MSSTTLGLTRRPMSPDFSFRRTSLNRQSLSPKKSKEDSLSSSLPLALTKKELEHLKEMERFGKSQKWQESYEELQERRGTFSTLRSPTRSPLNLGACRPRSASLCTTTNSNSPKRSFLGISRGRPTSAKLGVQHKASKLSSDVVTITKEANTHKVEAAFAQIKHQLEKLSEEDQMMQERVTRLMSEITKLASLQKNTRYHPLQMNRCGTQAFPLEPQNNLGYKRSKSNDQPSKQKRLSCNLGNITLSEVKETWEERSTEKSYEEEAVCVPFDMDCKEFNEHQRAKRCSLDSTGSAVGSTSSNTCVTVVTNGCVQENKLSSDLSQPEDDVFLSQ